MRFKIRLERMEAGRLVRNVYLWSMTESKWGKCFMKLMYGGEKKKYKQRDTTF